MDYILKSNVTGSPIINVPKYNNKVQNTIMFDKDTHIELPNRILKAVSMKGKSLILFENLHVCVEI